MDNINRRHFLSNSILVPASIAVPGLLIPAPANAWVFAAFARPVITRLAGWASGWFYRNTVRKSLVKVAKPKRSMPLNRRIRRATDKLAEEGVKQTTEWAAGKIYDNIVTPKSVQTRRSVELATARSVGKDSKQSCFAHCSTLGNSDRPVLAQNQDMIAMGIASQKLVEAGASRRHIAQSLYPIETLAQTRANEILRTGRSTLSYRTASGSFEARTALNRNGDIARLIGQIRRNGQEDQTFEWDLYTNGKILDVSKEIAVFGARNRSRSESKRLSDRRDWKLCPDYRDRIHFRSMCK